MRALLISSLVPLLSGCFLDRSTINVPLEPTAVAALQPGTSTADDVTRLLGAPTEVVQLGRRSAWRYEYVMTKRAGLFLLVFTTLGTDTQVDRVWIFLNEQDTVTHVGSTFDSNEAEYALPGFSSARTTGANGEAGAQR
jgi:hypothetical protein